jgi:hypothetical protein
MKVKQSSGINYGNIPGMLTLKTNQLLIWLQELFGTAFILNINNRIL